MTITGSCFCGQVHFSTEAEPRGARSCWCRDCQKIASGSPTVNVLFPEAEVKLEGEIGKLEKIADSGNRVERGFCPKCGSQIYSRTVEPATELMRIRMGVLDDPELIAPQATIWVASAPSWAPLDAALPQHPQGPPAAK